MSLFKKINAHYNLLMLKDLGRSKKYEEFFSLIESISKDRQLLLKNAPIISQVLNENRNYEKEKINLVKCL